MLTDGVKTKMTQGQQRDQYAVQGHTGKLHQTATVPVAKCMRAAPALCSCQLPKARRSEPPPHAVRTFTWKNHLMRTIQVAYATTYTAVPMMVLLGLLSSPPRHLFRKHMSSSVFRMISIRVEAEAIAVNSHDGTCDILKRSTPKTSFRPSLTTKGYEPSYAMCFSHHNHSNQQNHGLRPN